MSFRLINQSNTRVQTTSSQTHSDRSINEMGNAQNLTLDENEELPIQTDEVKETKQSLIKGEIQLNNEADVVYSTLEDGNPINRRRTETESVIVKRKNVVHEIMSK